MDFLLDKSIRIPDNHIVECYYFVDDCLRYVSITSDKAVYALCYVDANKVSRPIRQSENYYEFDYFVYNLNKPVKTQKCGYDVVNGAESRVVEVRTVSGNPKLKKPKSCNDEKPLVRDFTRHGTFF